MLSGGLKKDTIDLTKSQTAIWTGQRLNPDVPLYNMIFTFEFSGTIHVKNFQKSFKILVDKSDAMRTIFFMDGDVPQQMVRESCSPEIEFIDWSNDKDSDLLFKEWVSNRMQIRFDLSKCLYDAVLLKFSDSRFIFYLNQHHLITDAKSISIQYKALANIYDLVSNEEDISHYELPNFWNYTQFEKKNQLQLNGSSIEAYWEDTIKSVLVAPNLYGKVNTNKSTLSNRITLEIGTERTRQLIKLSKEKEIFLFTSELTLFNIFATILYSYVYRISEQKKIAIGSLCHNRVTQAFKNTPGLFIELMPMVATIKDNETFKSLLNRVKIHLVNFLGNAQAGSSSLKLNKSFNIVLNFITVTFSNFCGIECRAKWLHPQHIDSQHALRLEVHDFNQDGNFTLDFDINNSIIDEAKQNETVGHFLKLMDAFLENPNQIIDSVEILSNKESKIILDLGNGTEEISAEQNSILDAWRKCAIKFPNRKAVQFEDQSISYRELDEKSNQLANHLIQAGVKIESRVGLFLDRSIEMIIGIIGVLKSGGAFVPLDPIYPIDRIDLIIQQADISILVSKGDLTDKLPDNRPNFVDISLIESLITSPGLEILPSNLAYVIYTSGSTGIPKGAMIEHRNVVHLVDRLSKQIYSRYQDSLNVALIAPSIFDASIQQVFGALLLGHTLYIAPDCVRLDGNELLRFYNDFKIDVSDGTPAHLKLLLESISISTIPRHFIIGGEPLSSKLVKNFQSKFSAYNFIISNIYGVAECSVDSLCYDVHKGHVIEHAFIPIGKPLFNERVYILNEANQLQAHGSPGEICIGGHSVGRGYINSKHQTDSKFLKNPFLPKEKIFKTGDVGQFLSDGNIQFLGRKDTQVNINGFRIELGEIEHHMLSLKKDIPIF